MNRALRKEEGFTLVEIIVVIVIMAILAAIAVPSVLGYINDANDAKYIAEARSIYLACQVEETKYNAVNDTDAHAGETGTNAAAGTAIAAKVDTRMTTDGVDLVSVVFDPSTEDYTVKFNSFDKGVTAIIGENDEIAITTGAEFE